MVPGSLPPEGAHDEHALLSRTHRLVNDYALSKNGAIDYVTWSVDSNAKELVRFGDDTDKFLRAKEIELQRIPITSLRIHPADLFDVQLVWPKAAQQ